MSLPLPYVQAGTFPTARNCPTYPAGPWPDDRIVSLAVLSGADQGVRWDNLDWRLQSSLSYLDQGTPVRRRHALQMLGRHSLTIARPLRAR